jgi:hypothetical protein
MSAGITKIDRTFMQMHLLYRCRRRNDDVNGCTVPNHFAALLPTSIFTMVE